MSKTTKILLVLFWIMLAGALIYWFNTTHWHVYKNSEYGFSVLIPEDFIVKTDPYSVNDSTHFDFIITDTHDVGYLKIRAYDKPSDYKEPVGPFPKTISNEKVGEEITSYVFNGISGFRHEGSVEGGGGSFDDVEFVHGNKVWDVEFLAEEGNYPNTTFDKDIYQKIKNSFKLI